MLDLKEYKTKLLDLLKVRGSVPAPATTASPDPLALELMQALGGKDNIFSIDACMTRLRVEVKVLGLVNHEKLQKLGAIGVVIVGQEVQAIFGKRSDTLKQDLEHWFGLEEQLP